MPEDVLDEIYGRHLPRPAPARAGDASDAIKRIYDEEGADSSLGLAMARQEGGRWDTRTSGAGAQGPLQVMERTGLRYVTPDEWATPEGKIRASARYVRDLSEQFGNDPYYVTAAYHAGEGKVKPYYERGEQIPRSDAFYDKVAKIYTPDHVGRVLQNLQGEGRGRRSIYQEKSVLDEIFSGAQGEPQGTVPARQAPPPSAFDEADEQAQQRRAGMSRPDRAADIRRTVSAMQEELQRTNTQPPQPIPDGIAVGHDTNYKPLPSSPSPPPTALPPWYARSLPGQMLARAGEKITKAGANVYEKVWGEPVPGIAAMRETARLMSEREAASDQGSAVRPVVRNIGAGIASIAPAVIAGSFGVPLPLALGAQVAAEHLDEGYGRAATEGLKAGATVGLLGAARPLITPLSEGILQSLATRLVAAGLVGSGAAGMQMADDLVGSGQVDWKRAAEYGVPPAMITAILPAASASRPIRGDYVGNANEGASPSGTALTRSNIVEENYQGAPGAPLRRNNLLPPGIRPTGVSPYEQPPSPPAEPPMPTTPPTGPRLLPPGGGAPRPAAETPAPVTTPSNPIWAGDEVAIPGGNTMRVTSADSVVVRGVDARGVPRFWPTKVLEEFTGRKFAPSTEAASPPQEGITQPPNAVQLPKPIDVLTEKAQQSGSLGAPEQASEAAPPVRAEAPQQATGASLPPVPPVVAPPSAAPDELPVNPQNTIPPIYQRPQPASHPQPTSPLPPGWGASAQPPDQPQSAIRNPPIAPPIAPIQPQESHLMDAGWTKNSPNEYVHPDGQTLARTDGGKWALKGGNGKPKTFNSLRDAIPAAVEATKKVDLPALYAAHLRDNSFATINDARRFAEEVTGKKVKPGTPEAKQVDEAVEAGVVRRAREIVGESSSPEEAYARLLDLYHRQPNLGVRTSTSVAQQAYSTPVPLAYLASRLAGITPDSTVYEPTAGNGALLIGATPSNITATELNPARAASLRAQMPEAKVSEGDAIRTYHPNKSFDRVIANPPFGVVKNDSGKTQGYAVNEKYSTNEIDHAIALKALMTMKDDGRAVLIVGGSKSVDPKKRSDDYNSRAKRSFYSTLYGEYNVVDHFTVDGDLYSKQGAAWPVDVIVIDGRGKSSRALPAVDVPRIYKSYDELGELLNRTQQGQPQPSAVSVLGAVPQSARGSDQGRAGAGTGQPSLPEPARRPNQPTAEGVRDTRTIEEILADATGKGEPAAGGDVRVGRPANSRPVSEQPADARPPVGHRRAAASKPQTQPNARPASPEGSRANDAGAVGGRADEGAGRASDVGDIFDDVFDEMFGEKPKARPAKVNKKPANVRQTKNAQRSKKESPKPAASSMDDIAKGLGAIFKKKPLPSDAPEFSLKEPGFDQDAYSQAKPYFESAIEQFGGDDVRAAMKQLLGALNKQYGFEPDTLREMKPYITAFIEERMQPQAKTASEAKAIPRDQVKAEDGQTQIKYQPTSSARSVNTLVPVNQATATENALQNLQTRIGSLDKYVAKKLGFSEQHVSQVFSGEQVDALALAIDNFEKGAGFIIGDQTGLGKGRVVAGIIRYALQTGRTPIFVTEKPSLYGDMVRDLTDIGTPDVRPLMTNPGEAVPLDEDALAWFDDSEAARLRGEKQPPRRGKFLQSKPAEAHNPLLTRMANKGKLGDYDVIFTTYNQMQTVKGGNRTVRHDLLEAFAPGGVVIFDESHNAGGGAPKINKEGEAQLDRAQFARQMAAKADAVFYSSATFAKRPEVMDLYFKTDLAKAVADPADLPDVINKGGVPLQQAVSAMLTEAGQYLRRERSFDGIEYATNPVKVNREHAENVSKGMMLVNEFSKMMAGSVDAMDAEIKGNASSILHDGSTGEAGAQSLNFTSIMHNLIAQMLLSLKADAAADLAIESLKNGEKPVITVANTMGSFIEHFTKDNDLNPGDSVDLNFGDLLVRYLERSREVLIGDAFGAKTTKRLSDEELGTAAVAAFNKALRFIRNSNLGDMPISPIDWMHDRLRKAGYKTAEITGRNHTIDYGGAGGATYKVRPSGEVSTAGKKRAINGFNTGAIDALIINQSGSTGISLHAGEKFADQRRRHMILAQAEANIDTHMQMLGRINRTGQVSKDGKAPKGKPAAFGLPRYSQMAADIPAEIRPAAVLAKKMASLNANTTAARGSAVTAKDVVDFINEYGDAVAAQMMMDQPELNRKLGEPVMTDEDGKLTGDGHMRKVTGRIPLLPIAEQEKIYAQLEAEYNDTIAQLEAMGQNTLEAKTLPLAAETIKKETISQGREGGSPFERPAYAETMMVKRLGKPFTSAKVLEMLRAETGLGEDADLNEIRRKGRELWKETQNQEREKALAYAKTALQEYEDAIADAEKTLANVESEELRNAAESALEKYKRQRDTQKNKLNGVFMRWSQIGGAAKVGQPVALKMGDGTLYGIVTKVERKGQAENPVALGSWRVTVAVADAAQKITLPMSKLATDADDAASAKTTITEAERATVFNFEDGSAQDMNILEAFDAGQSASRERRTILTGNMLAAFAKFPKGQIINFTDEQGQVQSGILTPRGFNLKKEMNNQPVVLATTAHAMKYLDEAYTAQIRTPDEGLLIKPERGLYVFAAASAKGTGGKYYLNQGLIKAAGAEFVKSGSKMQVKVEAPAARKMLDALLSGAVGGKPAVLHAMNAKDAARKITGEGKPAEPEFAKTPTAPKGWDTAENEVQRRPRVAHRWDNSPIDERTATPEQMVAGMRSRIVPPKGDRYLPVLWGNRATTEVLTAILSAMYGRKIDVHGMDIPRESLEGIVSHLLSGAEALKAEANPQGAANFYELAARLRLTQEKMAALGYDSIQYADADDTRGDDLIVKVQQHEIVHAEQHKIGKGTPQIVSDEWAKRDPDFRQLKMALIAYGGTPRNVAVEAIAHIASGDYEQMGYTGKDGLKRAASFARRYAEEVARQHGVWAVKQFRYVRPEFRQVFKEVAEKYEQRDEFRKTIKGIADEYDRRRDENGKPGDGRDAALGDSSQVRIEPGDGKGAAGLVREGGGSDSAARPASARDDDQSRGRLPEGRLGRDAGSNRTALAIRQETLPEFSIRDIWDNAKDARVLTGLRVAAESIQRGVAAHTVDPLAGVGARALDAHRAQMERDLAIAEKALEDLRAYFNKLLAKGQKQQAYDFIDRIEEGQDDPDPKMDRFAKTMRRALDDLRNQIQALGEGQLQHWYENYFPHYWKRPKEAEGFFRTWFQNRPKGRPFEGTKSFTKKRVFPTHKDGRDAGYEPLSDNPVDLFLWKAAEMSKFLMAHRFMDEMKEYGFKKYVRIGHKADIPKTPDGEPWKQIDDRMAQVYRIGDDGELIVAGGYFMPPTIADVLNNHLSPGLRGRKDAIGTTYRGLASINNIVTMFTLGWDATMAIMTGVSAVAFQFDQALADLQSGVMEGNRAALKRALVDGIQIPVAPITLWLKGRKIVAGWARPGMSPAIDKANELMVQAGARPYRDSIYDTDHWQKLKQTFREIRGGKSLGKNAAVLPKRLVFGVTEIVSDFFSKHYVPQIKAAAFAQRTMLEMERLGANANRDQVRQVASREGNVVDDIGGQMVYEKLHMHKIIEDVMKLIVGRAGFQVGAVRMAAKVAVHTLKTPIRIRQVLGGGGGKNGGGGRGTAGDGFYEGGTPPELPITSSMGTLIGLVLATGAAGLIFQWLMTGKKPKDQQDLFYPRDGGVDEDGKPTRVQLPTRLNSLTSLFRDPRRWAGSRESPSVRLISDTTANQDWRGEPILHADDTWQQAVGDVGRYIWKNNLQPSALETGIRFNAERKYGFPSSVAMGVLSISPAPRAAVQSAAERKISELKRKPEYGGMGHSQMEEMRLKADIVRTMRRGNEEEGRQMAARAIDEGKLSGAQLPDLMRRVHTPGIVWAFSSLSLGDALKVFEVATPEERQALRPALQKKMATLSKMPAGERERLLPQARKALEGQ